MRWAEWAAKKQTKSPEGTGERSISGKTQEDQYRQKVEDVFSGQEPIAKISGDVNSKALPVFKSVRDAQGCQDDIKQEKIEGRWHVGEVTHERGHGHVFRLTYCFLNWPSAQEQRQLTNHNKEGKSLESESCSPNTTIHRPITTHTIVACSSGKALISSKPPPSPDPTLPPDFFVHATPVIYSFNDKMQTSTHSSTESEDNHIRADDRDGNQTWAGSPDTDVDLHKSKQYRQQLRCAAPLFPLRREKIHQAVKCRIWIEGDRTQGENFSVYSGHTEQALFPVTLLVQQKQKHASWTSRTKIQKGLCVRFKFPCSLRFGLFLFLSADLHMNLITESFFFFRKCVSNLWNAF